MVLSITRWTIRPEKRKAYLEWTQGAIQRTLAAPGVIEFCAYRPVSGDHEVCITHQFADLDAWLAWYTNEGVQAVLEELRDLTSSMSSDLWGPSPVVPKAIRPGG